MCIVQPIWKMVYMTTFGFSLPSVVPQGSGHALIPIWSNFSWKTTVIWTFKAVGSNGRMHSVWSCLCLMTSSGNTLLWGHKPVKVANEMLYFVLHSYIIACVDDYDSMSKPKVHIHNATLGKWGALYHEQNSKGNGHPRPFIPDEASFV